MDREPLMPIASPQRDAAPTAHTDRSAARCDRSPVAELSRPQGNVRAWVRAVRVRQWSKNLLVFAAPAAAGALGRPGVFGRLAIAFAVFCLLASGAYLINDARDAVEDRRHPVKRHRPIAAGAISTTIATRVGVVVVLSGIGLSLSVSVRLLGIACAYGLLNVAYTSWLRRVAIADIAAIAGAFVLRALAGGIAGDVAVSRWFVLVVSFAALFVAAGKRHADFVDVGSRRSRPVLSSTTRTFCGS